MAATIELYLVRHAIAAERGPKYPDDRLRAAARRECLDLGDRGFRLEAVGKQHRGVARAHERAR